MVCSLLLALATKMLFLPPSEAAAWRPAPDAAAVAVTLIQTRHSFPRLPAAEAARNIPHGSAQPDPAPASRPTVAFSGLE